MLTHMHPGACLQSSLAVMLTQQNNHTTTHTHTTRIQMLTHMHPGAYLRSSLTVMLTHTHTHTHTHIHTHTHTHTLRRMFTEFTGGDAFIPRRKLLKVSKFEDGAM